MPVVQRYGDLFRLRRIKQNIRVERICNMVYLAEMNARGFEAVMNGVKRQLVCGKGNGAFAVLDVGKTFVFGCRQQLPVFQQARRGIVKGGIDTKCVHKQ